MSRICSRDIDPTMSGCLSWIWASTLPTSSSSDSPRTVSPHGQLTCLAISAPFRWESRVYARGGGPDGRPPRALSCLEVAPDPGQDVRQIDALRIPGTGTVDVVHVRVHAEHRVGAALEIRAARVAEAAATAASARIERRPEELIAVREVAGDELCRRIVPLARAGPAVERRRLREQVARDLRLELHP